MGAEDVVVDAAGNAWTGTEDGSVFRVAPDGSVHRVGNTGGRPLGIELYGEGRLLIADARQGLLVMSTTTGVVNRLLTEVDGTRMVFCNNAAVAANGDIWFSDSSTVHPIERWKADLVENTETRPAAVPPRGRDRRGARRRARLRQRGRPRRGRVLRLRGRDGPADRRTPVADGGAGRCDRPARERPARATPTTSRAAATA